MLGSIDWMNDLGLEWGENLLSELNDWQNACSPLVALGFKGRVRGLFVLEETIRPEAQIAIDECRRWNLDQAILTGDRLARATVLGQMLNLPIRSELLPDAKLCAIRETHERIGAVAMVGDGLNDAPALAAADIGIALGCGADVSRETAGICLMTADLRLVPWTYELSRRTVDTIRTNLAWSFGYNSLGVIAAATGQLHPAIAAVLMVVSSLMVLGNSLRLSVNVPSPRPRHNDDHVELVSTTVEGDSFVGVTP